MQTSHLPCKRRLRSLTLKPYACTRNHMWARFKCELHIAYHCSCTSVYCYFNSVLILYISVGIDVLIATIIICAVSYIVIPVVRLCCMTYWRWFTNWVSYMAQHLDVPSSSPAPADLQSAALPRQEEMSIKTRTMTLKKRIIKLVSKRKKGLPNLSLSNSKRYVLRIVSGG